MMTSYPSRFLGLPESDVVLLNLNPGFSAEEVEYHHLDRYFQGAALANLAQEQPYPFYFLDSAVKSPGHQWWQRRLGTLIQQFTAETLARRLLCLEFFPYHSERFDRAIPRIPSQGYTFALLRQAIERGAVIIVMRARAVCGSRPCLSYATQRSTVSIAHRLSTLHPAIARKDTPRS